MFRKAIIPIGAVLLGASVPAVAHASPAPSVQCAKVGTQFKVTGANFTPGDTYYGAVTWTNGGSASTEYTSIAGEFKYTNAMYHWETIAVSATLDGPVIASCTATIISPR